MLADELKKLQIIYVVLTATSQANYVGQNVSSVQVFQDKAMPKISSKNPEIDIVTKADDIKTDL